MKKIALFISSLLLAASASADYQSMLFKLTDGSERLAALSGLDMSFSDDCLCVSQGGDTFSIPLSRLASMEFSSLPAAVSPVSSSPEETEFRVYGIAGISCGTFRSLSEAKASLPAGTYISINNIGQTFKFVVTK